MHTHPPLTRPTEEKSKSCPNTTRKVIHGNEVKGRDHIHNRVPWVILTSYLTHNLSLPAPQPPLRRVSSYWGIGWLSQICLPWLRFCSFTHANNTLGWLWVIGSNEANDQGKGRFIYYKIFCVIFPLHLGCQLNHVMCCASLTCGEWKGLVLLLHCFNGVCQPFQWVMVFSFCWQCLIIIVFKKCG